MGQDNAIGIYEHQEGIYSLGDGNTITRHSFSITREPLATPNSLTDYVGEWTAPWRNQAACQGLSSIFFNGRGGNETSKQAIAVCMTCPVRTECLEFAIDNAQSMGIWAGLPLKWREYARVLIWHRGRSTAEAIEHIDGMRKAQQRPPTMKQLVN